MDKNIPRFSVYMIFNEDGEVMATTSTEELAENFIKEQSEKCLYYEVKVNNFISHKRNTEEK